MCGDMVVYCFYLPSFQKKHEQQIFKARLLSEIAGELLTKRWRTF
jgi:hypothetical protein